MTDGQIKALFTLLEYIAKMVVRVSTDTSAMRRDETRSRSQIAQEIRRLREANATLRAENRRLTAENKELHRFLNTPL